MIRCLITDGTAAVNESRWLAHLAEWMQRGVDLIQIRERDLCARDLAALTRQVLALPNPKGTRVLVNDRADVAIACRAHGVHLRDGSVEPELFARPGFIVTVACHNVEMLPAVSHADYVLLSPIFRGHAATDPTLGLDGLRDAVARSRAPILALGGVTRENEQDCVRAGAAGMAGIGYFAAPWVND